MINLQMNDSILSSASRFTAFSRKVVWFCRAKPDYPVSALRSQAVADWVPRLSNPVPYPFEKAIWNVDFGIIRSMMAFGLAISSWRCPTVRLLTQMFEFVELAISNARRRVTLLVPSGSLLNLLCARLARADLLLHCSAWYCIALSGRCCSQLRHAFWMSDYRTYAIA